MDESEGCLGFLILLEIGRGESQERRSVIEEMIKVL